MLVSAASTSPSTTNFTLIGTVGSVTIIVISSFMPSCPGATIGMVFIVPADTGASVTAIKVPFRILS